MKAKAFIDVLKSNGVTQFTGVPCSVFKEVIAYLEAHENYLIASSEGEAMGIAGGFSLAGKLPAVFMQNDGFGNTVNPITSLQKLYHFPTLLVISWRGRPGSKDAPQHLWSGKTLCDLLRVLDIGYVILEDNLEGQRPALEELLRTIQEQEAIGAIIVPKGLFEKEKVEKPPADMRRLSREQALRAVLDELDPQAAIFSTTGKISRELYKIQDRPQNFYTVGSMGCTSSIALGHYHARQGRTVVFDGDGAVLMKMGTLATIGYYQPREFLHICFDNESYESTGGQKTVSSTARLDEVARSCRYAHVEMARTAEDIRRFIQGWNRNPELSFLHIKVRNETDPELGRPQESPRELRCRFQGRPQ
jgi:phosphonopyruvate decarboxylase